MNHQDPLDDNDENHIFPVILAIIFTVTFFFEFAVALGLEFMEPFTYYALVVGLVLWAIVLILVVLRRSVKKLRQGAGKSLWKEDLFCVVMFTVSLLGLNITDAKLMALWAGVIAAGLFLVSFAAAIFRPNDGDIKISPQDDDDADELE